MEFQIPLLLIVIQNLLLTLWRRFETNGHTKIINRTLGNLVSSIFQEKPKQWDNALAHAKFSYNMLCLVLLNNHHF